MKNGRKQSRPIRSFLILLLSMAGLIQGCAQQMWHPSPGTNVAAFEPIKAECSLMARNSGGSFVAYGNANYVASAALGNAVGEAIRAKQNFNDCMTAHGWQLSTPETVAATQAKVASLKVVSQDAKSCLMEVRSRPQFNSLVQYLADPQTGKHSMNQRAVERLATPIEAHLFADLQDAADTCQTNALNAVERISPEVAGALRENYNGLSEEALRIIKHQETWSDYSVHTDHLHDILQERLKQIHL